MAWTERYCIDGGAGAHDGTSEAAAWSMAEAIANAAGGQRINVKAATFANTTTSRTFGTGGGAGATTTPKWWRGYKTAIGDMDGHPTSTRTAGTDFPLFTFTSGSVSVTDPHNIFSNIEFRATAPGQRLVGVTGSKCKFVRCRFDNQEAASTSYAVRASSDGVEFTECWFKATSSAFHVAMSEERLGPWVGCVFRGGGNGLLLDISGSSQGGVHYCVFDSNGGDAINVVGSAGNGAPIIGNTIYNPGGHGININNAVPVEIGILNNLFHTITVSGKYPIIAPSNTNGPHLAGNGYYNCTNHTSNIFEDLEFFRTDFGSDPLPNAASHDFTLDSSAKGQALAQLFENEAYKSFCDHGAVQRQESSGGTDPVAQTKLFQSIGTY